MSTLTLAVLVAMATVADAATPASFAPVSAALTAEIAELEAIGNPTPQDAQRLRTLTKAQGILADSSNSDGQALKGLVNTLKGPSYASYTPLLEQVAANLVDGLNKNYVFVGSLISEIPDEQAAAAAQAQYNALTAMVNRLNTADKLSKVAAQLEATRKRLNNVFTFISRLLIVPFPGELARNTVKATVNGVGISSSLSLASDNVFSAVVTDAGIVVNVIAVDGTLAGGLGRRGLNFSIPLVQSGTFSYAIPASASLTYRTDVYTDSEAATAATDGRIFVSTQGDEVFGVFSATGANFELIQGRFRINLTFPQ